jgi:hypothetical protein
LDDVNVKKWFKLDNMANLFPAIEHFWRAPVYRVSLELDREIKEDLLVRALNMVLPRFPYFKVELKKGVFWSYLEYNKKDAVVSPDCPDNPCLGINYRSNNNYLFKVKYHKNIIALEVFHALTDGGGALVLLKTLGAQYLRLCGETIAFDKDLGVWDIGESPCEEESRDSFLKYYNKDIKALGIKSPAYHFRGTKEKQDVVHVIKGVLNGKEVAAAAKKYGVSVTEFLTAVYIYSLMKVSLKTGNKRPIRISVPVNLRNIFPSGTMRNFTNFVICGIKPHTGGYTFEEIVSEVHHDMRKGLLKNNLIENFSGNVSSEKNFFVRILPLHLKIIMLSLIYSFRGENQYSGSFSNLGIIRFPDDMAPFVKGLSCCLAPNSINTTNCGAVCFGDRLVISFTRTIKESLIEREFFTFLVRQNLKVKIQSGTD